MTAGDGEGGGRHSRRDLSEEFPASDELAPIADELTEAAGDAGVTQALPVFRREASGEPSRVRAVAPRVASALPAIGGDEIRDAPASTRANIERRRRAQEEESGPVNSAAEDPVGPDPSLDDIELVPIGSQGWPRRVSGELLVGGGESPSASASTDPVDEVSPPAEPAPAEPASPAALEPAWPVSPSDPPASTATAEEPPARPSLFAPTEPGPAPIPPIPPVTLQLASPPQAPVSPPVAVPRPAPQSDPDGVVDAEIIEDPTGEHRAVVGATAAEMVNALTHIAFREAQTDEWATVPSDVAAQPALGGLSAGAELEAVPRSGPGLMTSDSWETTSLPVIPEDSYQGRRRRSSKGTFGRWFVVIAVVLALCAAIAIPFLITSGGGKDHADSTPQPSDVGLPGVIPSPTVQASDDPYMPIGAASATPSAVPSSPSSASHSATSSPSASAGSTTLQAESATLSGCAQVRAFSGASGGSIVDRLGGDWSGCTGDGVVTFNNVSLQAGNYTVTVYYVFGLTNSDPSRFGRLRIDPDGSGSNIDFSRTFQSITTCCQSWTTGRFTVSAGTFDISFTNPGVPGQDRAPAVDRIVIQKV